MYGGTQAIESDTSNGLSPELFSGLLRAAQYFQVQDVVYFCATILHDHIDVYNMHEMHKKVLSNTGCNNFFQPKDGVITIDNGARNGNRIIQSIKEHCEILRFHSSDHVTRSGTIVSLYEIKVDKNAVLDSIILSTCELVNFKTADQNKTELSAKISIICKDLKYACTVEQPLGKMKYLQIPKMHFSKSGSVFKVEVHLCLSLSCIDLVLPALKYNSSVVSEAGDMSVTITNNLDEKDLGLPSAESYIDQSLHWIGPGISIAFEEAKQLIFPTVIEEFKFTTGNVLAVEKGFKE